MLVAALFFTSAQNVKKKVNHWHLFDFSFKKTKTTIEIKEVHNEENYGAESALVTILTMTSSDTDKSVQAAMRTVHWIARRILQSKSTLA